MKRQKVKQILQSKIHLIRNSEKEETTQNDPSLLKSYPRQLTTLQNQVDNELDKIWDQIMSGDLTEEVDNKMLPQVVTIPTDCTNHVATLKSKFNML